MTNGTETAKRPRVAAAKKAAPKKAATPRARTPKPAPPPAVEATEDVSSPPPSPDGRSIEVNGKTILVKQPTGEQLAIWKRVATRMAKVTLTTADEASAAIDRILDIIMAVMPDEADHDWLETQLIKGTMDLHGAAQILQQALDAFGMGSAAAAPTTGPVARRRR